MNIYGLYFVLGLCSFTWASCSSGESPNKEPPPAATVGTLSFEVVSEGDGEPNALPVALLPIGQLLLVPESAKPARAVVGLVKFGDKELIEVWHGDKRAASWELVTSEGLVRYGDSLSGLYKAGMLLLPAEVRMGKSWRSGGRDFEVVGKTDMETAWGRLPAWEVNQVRPDAASDCSRFYAEGFGLVEDRCDASGEFKAGLQWLPESTPAAATPLELTPLEMAGEQVEVHGTPNFVWAVDEDPGVKPMVITLDTFDVHSPPEYRSCLQVDPGGDVFERLPVPVEGHIIGAGSHHAVVRGPATCPYGEIADNQWDNLHDRHALTVGMRKDGKGGVWYGNSMSDGAIFAVPGVAVPHPLVGLADFGGLEPAAIPWNSIGNYNLHFMGPLLAQMGNPEPYMTIPGTEPVDGRLPVGVVMPSGLLFNTLAETTGMFSPFVPGPFVGPFLTARASPTQRDVLLASPGGSIDRLILTGGVWKRMPLVSVALPEGEQSIGAVFSLGKGDGEQERLLVLTRATGVIDLPTLGGLEQPTEFPVTRFWTVDVPENAPQRPTMGLFSVTAQKLDGDVRVCWEPAGEPEITGWTIGGAPAASVIPHGSDSHCVAVFRDSASALAPDEPGGVQVEGPVPGVGRVRVSLPPGEEAPEVPFEGGAALKGGGFIGLAFYFTSVVFGDGAIPLFPVNLGDPSAVTLEDIAGHGLWLTRRNSTRDGIDLCLANGDGVKVMKAGTPMVKAAGGGGVVVENWPTSGIIVVKPDGTEQTLPWAKLAPMSFYTVLADGTICGHRASEITIAHTRYSCIDPDGTERAEEWAVDDAGLPNRDFPNEWPLPTGHIVISEGWGARTWLVDPQSLTFTVLAQQTATEVRFDSSGRLFGNFGANWFEVTADGLVELDLNGADALGTTLYVDEEYYIVGTKRVKRVR
jgi:hypothetical protein